MLLLVFSIKYKAQLRLNVISFTGTINTDLETKSHLSVSWFVWVICPPDPKFTPDVRVVLGFSYSVT